MSSPAPNPLIAAKEAIEKTGAAVNEKIKEGFMTAGNHLEQTADNVGEAFEGLSRKAVPVEAAAEAKQDAAGGPEPGCTGGIAKVFEESAGAISQEASQLNQKIIAGFDQLGDSLKAVPGVSEEGESKLAALGDKIVEAVIEKPAGVISEALGPVVDKITAGLFPAAAGGAAPASGGETAQLLQEGKGASA